ncbi:hypothetical protein ABB37_08091 [Leptomonas pyrrhocoris]|uniref:Uncharacterized protein n=1 Tax=Leptomonas pyrrhocoris TaxID=157538 RepID=A0A0M9FTV6_LEPPY|nr:hypothetical protein ABB37_08091 [Leptomonas pyrrhocoris]KPA75923.1 hypothetical protein ABB37_08091 [Leptomonas pyrrhocoris]|eukprot:XP_015654362.1 hypothetical protein ABB37_08091 [Leptomonas pyrrhocoris]
MQATVEPSPLPPVVGGAVAAAASTTALTQHGLRALPTSTTTIGSAAASTADTADGTVASLIVVPTVGAGGRGEEGSNSNSSRRRSRGFSALLARFAPQQHPPPQRHSFSPFHSLYTVPSPDTVNSSTPLPHLETVTDWEVLMRSDAMAELRERQRLDTANVTAADLPNPPSVGLPLGNKIRPSSQARDDLHSTSVSRSGYKGFSPYQKNSKDTARRANSSGNIVRDAATAAAAGLQSPARRTSHTPSPLLPLRLPPVSLGRSIQSHMCIDDVVASCTLQSVAPLPWQSARYPDGDRSGSSHISAHNSLPPHSGDVSGRGAFRLPDGNNNNNGVSRTARLTVPGEMPPGARTRSVDYAAGTVDTQDSDGACLSVPPARPQLASTLTDVADVSFSSPYSLRRDSTSALWLPSHNSAPQVQLSVPGCHKDVPRIAGGKGEGDAATDHVRAGRHQLHSVTGAKRNVVDASSPFTTVVTPAINPDTADPANEATIDGDEHVFPPQQQQREERALSFSPSLHHGVNMATTTTGTGTTASPFFSPPPPAQLPIPHLPRPLPVRACNSQAAALVELRVRSAQHAALIQRIRIPTLLLHARDDPVAPPSTLPFSLLQANPWISTVLTRRGSHGVFMESASDVWRRPFLVLREEAAQTRGHREGRGKQRANDTSTANAATTAATTHRCDINDSSRKSDGADKDDCCSTWGGDGGEASPLPSLEKERAAHATQWRLRIAGTTWVERLLFEYVEQVVVAPATARSTMINTSTN